MSKYFTFGTSVLFSLMLVLAINVSATEYTVCPSGCNYTIIQEAIGNASSGDTISIGAGTYTEQLYIDKSLNIIGSSPDEVIIKMPDSGINSYSWNSGNKPLIGIDTSTGVNVSNIKLNSTGHDTSGYSGVHYWKSSGNVSNCKIYGFYDGIVVNHVWDVSYPTHTDITNNYLYGSGNRITCTELDTDVTITDNIVVGFAGSDNGIQIGYGASGDIKRNKVYNLTRTGEPYQATGIILAGGVDGSEISYNVIDNCSSGIFIYNDIYYGYDGENNTNISHNNVSNSVYGIVVEGKCYNTKIHYNKIEESSLYNGYSKALSVNATSNWWGSTTPNASKFYGNITYYPFSINPECSLNIDEEITEFSVNTTDFSAITEWHDVKLLLDGISGMINWTQNINLIGSCLKFDDYIQISHNRISVDITTMPELDQQATLIFKNAGYTDTDDFSLKRNGVTCPATICSNIRIQNGNVLVDVTQMSDYWLEDSVLGGMPSITANLVVTLGFGIIGIFTLLNLLLFTIETDPKNFIRIMITATLVMLFLSGVFVAIIS